MKKFINILLAAAVTALAVVSCQKEEQVKPGTPDPEGCYGVYFPVQESTGSHTYDPEMDRVITFTVARTNTNGAITVPYSVKTDTQDVFVFGDIVFADGQAETELEVTFDNIKEGETCAFSIQLNDDNAYVSHYNTGAIALDFSVIVVKWEYVLNPNTKEPAVVTFTEGWWGIVVEAKVKYFEVNGVRTCETCDEVVVVSYNEDAGDVGFWGAGEDNHLHFTWFTNKKDGNKEMIDVEKQYFGYDYDDWLAKPIGQAGNPIFAYDWFHYLITDGGYPGGWPDWEGFLERNPGAYDRSYYDGNGGFFLNLRYYIPGLGGWTPDPFDTVGIVEGYVRVDYSLEVATDYPDEGVTPVLFTVGADVAKVDYAIYEGSLNSVQIQARIDAIAKGEEENVVTIDEFTFDENEEIYYAYAGVSPETTGEYTLVAVSFNKTTEDITESKAQKSGSISFFHVAADDDADYDVEVSVFTEDTPARYQELHSYDSFAYGVSGKDLTEVHVAFYTSDLVQKYGLAAVVADAKADEDGEYAVSADVLAQINADGGYYTLATGVKAKTTYVVVVWATNGSKEGYAYAAYTTAALPYVWNSLGKGTLTDGFLLPDWSMDDATVACDVYEEASTPGLYMVTGFQLELAAIFYEVEPSVILPYEGEDANWWNAQIVVDATNPAKVSIAQQQYGIYTNGTYQYPLIWSVADGTLENGAITFPANGLVVGYTGNNKAYYTNPDGTFKITLPGTGGESPTSLPTGTVKKTNFTHAASKAYTKPVVKYEREVKSISVETKSLTYTGRKASQTQSTRMEPATATKVVLK